MGWAYRERGGNKVEQTHGQKRLANENGRMLFTFISRYLWYVTIRTLKKKIIKFHRFGQLKPSLGIFPMCCLRPFSFCALKHFRAHVKWM